MARRQLTERFAKSPEMYPDPLSLITRSMRLMPWRAKKTAARRRKSAQLFRSRREDLGIGQACRIVDGDVEKLPAYARAEDCPLRSPVTRWPGR